MEGREEYKVIYPFRDLKEKSKKYPNGKKYAVGDTYLASKHSKKRVDELLGTNNKIGRSLIKVTGR